MHRQRTLSTPISCTGIGLHSGKLVRLSIKPAPVDHGIVFERVDIPGRPALKVAPNQINSSDHATTLGTNGVRIATVEHLMAALHGLGVDNALVEINADEVPVMDGSAGPFVYLIKTAGIRIQHRSKKFLAVRRKFTVRDGDRWIDVLPSKKLHMSFTIDFAHPLIEKQNYNFEFSVTGFERELSRARTFGFLHEVEMLKKRGLALGGSLNNAIVIGRFRVLNEEGLRFQDEFVRHKLLDQVGDLAILGAPLIARIRSYKSGHALNHAVVEQITRNPDLVRVVTFDETKSTTEVREALPAWSLPDWATA